MPESILPDPPSVEGEPIYPHQNDQPKQDRRARWMAAGLVTLTVVMALTLLPRDMVGVVLGAAVILLAGGVITIKSTQNWSRIQPVMQRVMVRLEQKRALIGAALAIAAAGVMVLAGNRLGVGASDDQLEAGLAYGLLGIGLAGLASLTLPQRAKSTPKQLVGHPNWILFGVGCFILWVVAEANGQLVHWKMVANLRDDAQFLGLVSGVGLVVAGLGGMRWPKTIHVRREVVWEWVAVIGIVVVGFGLRLWQLESAVHKFIDEMNFGTVVLYFEGNDRLDLLNPLIRGFPLLYAYWQHWGVDLYGHDLYALRIVSVVLGTLTIPAVYLLGRELVDRRTGLMAAALLAAFPPHIHHSRLGIGIISDPLFGTLALAFMARAIKTQKSRDYALSGACLGLTQYFYEAGRLLYPPLMLAWVGLGCVLWRVRPARRGLLITLLAALVVGAPIYYTLVGIHAPFTPRMAESGWVSHKASIPAWEDPRDAYINRLKTTFRVYTNLPESVILYYGGDHAFLLGALIPFFLLGVAHTFWRVRSRVFLLMIWLVSTSVGNSLIKDVTISARYVVVFPALALLVAVGIRDTVALIWPKKLPTYGQSIVLAGLVVGLCIYQVDFFMGAQLTRFNEQISPEHQDIEDALFRAKEFPAGTHIYIVTDDYFDYAYAQSILLYLKPGLKFDLMSRDVLTWLYLEAIPRPEDSVFFLAPTDTRTFDRLRRFYVLLPAQKSPYNVPVDEQFLMYVAPAYLQQHPNQSAMGIEPQPN